MNGGDRAEDGSRFVRQVNPTNRTRAWLLARRPRANRALMKRGPRRFAGPPQQLINSAA